MRFFAQPVGTYAPDKAIEKLKWLNESAGIERLVVGWPLKEDGTEGDAVAFVQSFEKRLRKALPNVGIYRWDERYSSVMARQAIIEAGVRRKARRDKGRVDAAAAAVILQQYLDALRSDQSEHTHP